MRKFWSDVFRKAVILFLYMIIIFFGALFIFSVLTPMILLVKTNQPIWCFLFLTCPFFWGLFSTVAEKIIRWKIKFFNLE